jgi:hypothetical protein
MPQHSANYASFTDRAVCDEFHCSILRKTDSATTGESSITGISASIRISIPSILLYDASLALIIHDFAGEKRKGALKD